MAGAARVSAIIFHFFVLCFAAAAAAGAVGNARTQWINLRQKPKVLKGNGTKFSFYVAGAEEEEGKFVKMADGTGNEFFIFILSGKQ